MCKPRTVLAVLLALAACGVCSPAAPAEGPGGPILVVADDAFGRYYAEILRAEGLNEFAVAGRGALDGATLAQYQVVLLAQGGVSAGQAAALQAWVQGGGNLIAMRPHAALAPLLGLGGDVDDLTDGYLRVAQSGPGAGIAAETMQFHGTADLRAADGAATVATLYADASSATSYPAVTLRSVGAGQAAAFAYDLARSVVFTRQGNPAWTGQERDGELPRRSDDLFFGGSQADWVDPLRVHIPQADEQQRLLANLITLMNLDRMPLPRFWYLPRGLAAAVVMTGDDHGTGGTDDQFDEFDRRSPADCSVADWTCVGATSYVYAGTSVPNAADYERRGHEIALHLQTGCANASASELRDMWSTQLANFESNFSDIAAPRTNRTHCIAWSGWVDDAVAERAEGIRLDTNYYYWPPSWLQDPTQPFPRPGMFTGSGFPMRFADTDGTLVDVYQATTQLVDEWGSRQADAVGVETHINALLDRAVGPEGYYGVFTANMHTDQANVPHPGATAIVDAAQDRGVPVVSAAQMLTWLDGRNASSFQGLSFSGGRLQFSVAPGAGSHGLRAMVPASGPTGPLTALTRSDGSPVGGVSTTIKGVGYVMFDAAAGGYVATYGTPAQPPQTFPPAQPTAPTRVTARPSDRGREDGPALSGDGRLLRARIVSRAYRVSRDGIVRLRVRCPAGAGRCRVGVRLRHRGTRLAKRNATLADGRTTTVKLRLIRAARARIARHGSLRGKTVLRHDDGERGTVATTTRIRLLAPRRR